jgi:hypothetical protein
MRDMLDSSGVAISGVKIIYCRPRPDAHIIKARTLAGTWHVQTVGDPAWQADVQALVTGTAVLKTLQDAWAAGSSVTVRYDGMAYTGLISESPRFEILRRSAAASRKFTVTFILLISSEEAVS